MESKPMLMSKAQLSLHKIAKSVEMSRPQLRGIHFGQDGKATVTDGHIMIRVTGPNADSSEFPSPSADWQAPEIPAEGFILPADTAEAAYKAIPKKVHVMRVSAARIRLVAAIAKAEGGAS